MASTLLEKRREELGDLGRVWTLETLETSPKRRFGVDSFPLHPWTLWFGSPAYGCSDPKETVAFAIQATICGHSDSNAYIDSEEEPHAMEDDSATPSSDSPSSFPFFPHWHDIHPFNTGKKALRKGSFLLCAHQAKALAHLGASQFAGQVRCHHDTSRWTPPALCDFRPDLWADVLSLKGLQTHAQEMVYGKDSRFATRQPE